MSHKQTRTVLPKYDVDKMSSHMGILDKRASVPITTCSSNSNKDKADMVKDRKIAVIRFNMSRDDLGTLDGNLKCRRNNIDTHNDITLHLVGENGILMDISKGDDI
jgi:hypothetical protein